MKKLFRILFLSAFLSLFSISNHSPIFSFPHYLIQSLIPTVAAQPVDPAKYLATLRFQHQYWDYLVSKQEQVFPVSFTFNTTQDGNNDGSIDPEDACENIVRYAIGDSIYGTGRTGLPNRGPNDQRPAVYFHFVKTENYDVYEYWLYYADNDYLNNHEHDWEKYFVYEQNEVPAYVRISSHGDFNLFTWDELPKDDGHIIIGVDGGAHAMGNKNYTGVQIRYNGEISKNEGRLDEGDGQTIPWIIYSNDSNVVGSVNYAQTPDTFFYGDPVYPYIPSLSDNDEYGSPNNAPWKRSDWDSPTPVPLASVEFMTAEKGVVVFPNPNNGEFNVRMSKWENERIEITIYNMLGEIMYSQKSLNFNLPEGLYIYRITAQSKIIATGKFVVE